MNLSRPLALLVLAALVPLIVLSAVLGVASLRQQQGAMEREALDRVNRISSQLGRELDLQAQVLKSLTHLPVFDLPAPEREFAAWAERLRTQRPLWTLLILSDPQGNRIAEVPEMVGGQPGKVVELPSHDAAVSRREPVIGRIAFGPRGQPAFAVRAPVIRDGRAIYVVSAVVRPDGIRDLLLSNGLPTGWLGVVTDTEGRIIARTAGPLSLVGGPASESVRAANARGGEGIYEGISLEGDSLVTAYSVLPGTGWSVHLGIPREIYRAPLARSIWLLGVGAAISLLLAGTFLWLLAREARLRSRQAAAIEQARRMEALGRMTGGVAHDFNNLLMVILGNLEILQPRLRAVTGADNAINAIRRAAERGTHLTRELLSFSRGNVETRELQAVDVNQQVRNLLGMMRQSLRSDIRIELDLSPDLLCVRADPIELDLALLNIAVNARDAMPHGGALRIATRRASFPDRSGRHGIALMVSDTGAGVPENILPHVFEPFFTTKEVGKGTGLGLSQVYGFAKRAGGMVDIDSKIGRGTRITIFLPEAQPADTPRPAKVPPPVTRVESGEATDVLIVDDNPDVRSVTAACLSEAGLVVTEAEDAQSALALLERHRVGLVVSDIIMPGELDGVGLAREIRRRWPAIPVLLVSGYSASAVDAAREGFQVLAKPYRMAELVEAVQEQQARAAERRAAPRTGKPT